MKTRITFMATIIAVALPLPALAEPGTIKEIRLAELKKNPDKTAPQARAKTSGAPGKPVRAETNTPIPGIDVVVPKQPCPPDCR
jgi:hypothetical protein